ncbi:MAG: hypothetical protein ACD_46C00676G0002 [uncultured bacterium]|nr:MAG: hypothetical protein ACD_46C00676G0002 [uncultured bacterium]
MRKVKSKHLLILIFLLWAGFITYRVGTPVSSATAASFTISKCQSIYEASSGGGIMSSSWLVYTNLHQWFYTAKANSTSSTWGYTTCNTGDAVAGVRLHPFDLGGGAGSLGVDVICCKL